MHRLVLVERLILITTLALSGCSTLVQEKDVRRTGFAPEGPIAEGETGNTPLVGPLEPTQVDLTSLPTVDPTAPKSAPEPKRSLRPRMPIPDELADNLRAAAEFLEPSSGIQVFDDQAISPKAPTIGLNFDGPDGTDNASLGVPPDPELAVGPSHAIAAVNSIFSIYSATNGALLSGPIEFDTFFNSVGCSGTFDPNALYDEETDRYFLGIDANNGTAYCFGASATSNPVGIWNVYAVTTATGGDFFDYPHAGVGEDAIFMGANVFLSGGGVSPDVWAFDKSAMYAGGSVSFVKRTLSGDTPQPMNAHGFAHGTWPKTGAHYFLTDHVFNGSTVGMWSWTDPLGANVLALTGTVNLNTASGVTAGFPVDTPQSGGGNLQGNDFRVQDAEYRNGTIWTAQTIACNPGAGTVNCIRWAEISPLGPEVRQAGTFASTGSYRSFADLAVNDCDDMTVGYTKSSSSIFPAIFFTGRLAGDGLGLVQTEAQLKAGEITYTAFDSVPRRWGDYTGATSDPDGIRTWYLGEYSKDTGTTQVRWGTRIGELSTSCVPKDRFFTDGFESGNVSAWTAHVP